MDQKRQRGRSISVVASTDPVQAESFAAGASAATPAGLNAPRLARISAIQPLSARLTQLQPAATRREVRGDRVALFDHGLAPTSFPYPYGSHDDPAEQIVAAGGYNSAPHSVWCGRATDLRRDHSARRLLRNPDARRGQEQHLARHGPGYPTEAETHPPVEPSSGGLGCCPQVRRGPGVGRACGVPGRLRERMTPLVTRPTPSMGSRTQERTGRRPGCWSVSEHGYARRRKNALCEGSSPPETNHLPTCQVGRVHGRGVEDDHRGDLG